MKIKTFFLTFKRAFNYQKMSQIREWAFKSVCQRVIHQMIYMPRNTKGFTCSP